MKHQSRVKHKGLVRYSTCQEAGQGAVPAREAAAAVQRVLLLWWPVVLHAVGQSCCTLSTQPLLHKSWAKPGRKRQRQLKSVLQPAGAGVGVSRG